MPLSTRGAAAASDAVSIRNRCSPPAVLVSQLREHRQILDAWDGRVMQYEQVPSCAGASCFVGKPPELVLAHFSVMKSRNGCIENQHAQAVTSAENYGFCIPPKGSNLIRALSSFCPWALLASFLGGASSCIHPGAAEWATVSTQP
jgi:hypothetical protein